MENEFTRTISLIGEDGFNKINNVTICLFGLGGVGGTALEALARSGFSSFVIVDFDKVNITNLNRQILFNHSSIDILKTEEAKKRILSINPQAKIEKINEKVDNLSFDKIKQYKIDFIVDAIDDINGKKAICHYALDNNIPFIVSLGMANRINPSEVIITRLDKTSDDPLAKKLRHEFKKDNIDIKRVETVFSKEKPIKNGTVLSSMMMVPSSAGLNIAYYIISYFVGRENDEKHL